MLIDKEKPNFPRKAKRKKVPQKGSGIPLSNEKLMQLLEDPYLKNDLDRVKATGIVETCSNSSYQGEKIASINSEIKKMDRILKGDLFPGNTCISDMSDNQIMNLLSSACIIESYLRDGYLKKDMPEYSYISRQTELANVYPITVAPWGKALFSIKMPLLVPYPFPGSYNIYFCLKDALDVYLKEHPIPDIKGEHLLLLYERHSPQYNCSTPQGSLCDNDNWEMGRVTNAIAESIHYSDNSAHFSMLYHTVADSKNFTMVYLILWKDFPEFITAHAMCEHPGKQTMVK